METIKIEDTKITEFERFTTKYRQNTQSYPMYQEGFTNGNTKYMWNSFDFIPVSIALYEMNLSFEAKRVTAEQITRFKNELKMNETSLICYMFNFTGSDLNFPIDISKYVIKSIGVLGEPRNFVTMFILAKYGCSVISSLIYAGWTAIELVYEPSPFDKVYKSLIKNELPDEFEDPALYEQLNNNDNPHCQHIESLVDILVDKKRAIHPIAFKMFQNLRHCPCSLVRILIAVLDLPDWKNQIKCLDEKRVSEFVKTYPSSLFGVNLKSDEIEDFIINIWEEGKIDLTSAMINALNDPIDKPRLEIFVNKCSSDRFVDDIITQNISSTVFGQPFQKFVTMKLRHFPLTGKLYKFTIESFFKIANRGNMIKRDEVEIENKKEIEMQISFSKYVSLQIYWLLGEVPELIEKYKETFRQIEINNFTFKALHPEFDKPLYYIPSPKKLFSEHGTEKERKDALEWFRNHGFELEHLGPELIDLMNKVKCGESVLTKLNSVVCAKE